MPKVRITCDGEGLDAKIVDLETGKNVENRTRDINIHVPLCGPVSASIELSRLPVDIIAEANYFTVVLDDGRTYRLVEQSGMTADFTPQSDDKPPFAQCAMSPDEVVANALEASGPLQDGKTYVLRVELLEDGSWGAAAWQVDSERRRIAMRGSERYLWPPM